MMRLAVLIFAAAASVRPAHGADDPLARARQLYNQRNFAEAVQIAEQARLTPARADAADLVAARAYLELYRESGASDDLTNARDRLRRLDPQKFGPRDRAEYVVGLGETLFFDSAFGAAATVFDAVLQSRDGLTGDARERVLDWWATAKDRFAQTRPIGERADIYGHIATRMAQEISRDQGSQSAAYWLAESARGAGDPERAFNEATAAWVRAVLARDGGVALRADLDRLMVHGILPDRVSRLQLRDTTQALAGMIGEWEAFKSAWAR